MSFTETAPSNEATGQKPEQTPVVVKKYANRRLYNTESSSYITLDNLATMIRQSRDFVVYDAKTGEDITRGVLTQIIVEEESKGRAMLPTAFLRQIIGFYGDSLQQFVPSYLEQAMSSFAMQQEQMRTAMQETMGNLFPGMQEVSRQNMVMMERAMSLFAPFYRAGANAAAEQGIQPAGHGTPAEYGVPAEHEVPEQHAQAANLNTPEQAEADPGVQAMQREIESLRKQLAAARLVAITPQHGPNEANSATAPEGTAEPAA